MTPPPVGLPPHLTLPAGLHIGSKCPAVKLLQEWLNFHGETVAIDGDFGPKTAAALDRWRDQYGDDDDAALDAERLVAPMTTALAATGSIIDIARGYLEAGAREIGGNNRGMWVRLFTGGLDGDGYLWCGYATRWWARQAGHPWAERISPSCDTTALNAVKDGRLLPHGSTPSVGDLFLLYRLDGAMPGGRDYYHTGIVASVKTASYATIEGNSNDDGSSNGHEVAANWRTIHRGGTVFVRMGS